MTDPHPRGRETTHELTEVRTVLSRAESAIERILFNARMRREDPGATWYGADDPEMDDMLSALSEVVLRLDRWRRTGRPRKGPGPRLADLPSDGTIIGPDGMPGWEE